ncbi:hypothetical protein TELCIR_12546 [Teladorsagia circumcincta]|uniref:Uncharacterized protein n=1 Tax=Teladorsagia circumcincta TaxID=45464 RepID=A0A2G9U6H3_TELCI|nr:hypothetical protein TELCIR_12546 [Teladorsagia circumcincta]
MPSHRWESPLPRTIYDDAPDDDPVAPLRHAGVYTEKDILKMRKALTERKIECLKLHVITLGETAAAVAAACASLDDYGRILKRIVASQKYKSGEWVRTEPPRCSFGKVSKNTLSKADQDTISSVVDAIVDCVVEEKADFVDYLKAQESRDQMLDERQNMLFPCSVCHTMCIDIHSPPLCGKHLVDFSRFCQRQTYALEGHKNASFTFDQPFIRSSADFSSVKTEMYVRKRCYSEAPSQLSVGEALTQGQSPAVTDAIRRAEMRRVREDEAYSCARIRPFDRSNFPPKPSVPRRITVATRPPIPVRRPGFAEGALIQSQVCCCFSMTLYYFSTVTCLITQLSCFFSHHKFHG